MNFEGTKFSLNSHIGVEEGCGPCDGEEKRGDQTHRWFGRILMDQTDIDEWKSGNEVGGEKSKIC